MSNGHLERVLSALKLIKSDRGSALGEDTLDNLLRIVVDAPPLSQWDSTQAVRLWWNDKQRRNVSDTRSAPRSKTSTQPDDINDDQITLSDWEDLFD